MMHTFQIKRVLNNIIEKLKHPLTDKGTNTQNFREYQRIFNKLSDTNKKYIIQNLLYSRGRLVRHGFDTKQSVHLEGLGTFKYCADREMFHNTFKSKIEQLGYNKATEVPKELKQKLINESNRELDEIRISQYFERIAKNKEKRVIPKPISIKLNNGGKW